jgi:serine/threonine protein kinase
LQGVFGTTSSAEVKLDGKKKVEAAVTVLPDLAACPESTQVLALQSAVLLTRFNHENVLKLMGAVLEGPSTMIISELCDEGNLNALLGKKPANIRTQLKFSIEISAGMHHVASHNVVHRDLRT